MTPSSSVNHAGFVVAVPFRTDYYNAYATTLHKLGLLRLYALGTRRGLSSVPPEKTALKPLVGLLSFAAAKLMPSAFRWESFRFGLNPMLDRWVKTLLKPGDHILSSYGYVNESFKWVRKHGGKTFLEAGNSHPDNFWQIMEEEHARWNWQDPPVSRSHYRRQREMMAEVDYVLAPSSFVANSFLSRGFSADRVLRIGFPVDLRCFSPASEPRPKDRPLRVINTGGLSLRKGTPYLLEAFRIVLKHEPEARLLLTRSVVDSMQPILPRYRDLPIDWSPPLAHPDLAARLRSADIFVLPSLEEGLARTSLEAIACGLPAVVTPNTGSNDFVTEGVNGSVVQIRDPQAIAEAILFWWQKIREGQYTPGAAFDTGALSMETFEATLEKHLASLGFFTASL